MSKLRWTVGDEFVDSTGKNRLKIIEVNENDTIIKDDFGNENKLSNIYLNKDLDIDPKKLISNGVNVYVGDTFQDTSDTFKITFIDLHTVLGKHVNSQNSLNIPLLIAQDSISRGYWKRALAMPHIAPAIMAGQALKRIDRYARMSEFSIPTDYVKCTCDIHNLMNHGCKCGAIAVERQK